MVKVIISSAIVLMAILDLTAIELNRRHRHKSKLWTIVSICTAASICILSILVLVLKLKTPGLFTYTLPVAYAMLFFYRIWLLCDMKNDKKTDRLKGPV